MKGEGRSRGAGMSWWIRGCGVFLLIATGVAGALGGPAPLVGGLSPLAGAPTACPVLLSVFAPGGGVPVPVQLVGSVLPPS